MSTLRKLRRNLNKRNVWIATELEKKKLEIIKEIAEEELSESISKPTGETLPSEIITNEEVSEIKAMSEEAITCKEISEKLIPKTDAVVYES